MLRLLWPSMVSCVCQFPEVRCSPTGTADALKGKFEFHAEPALRRFDNVPADFGNCGPIRKASGHGRYLRPVAALGFLMYHYVKCSHLFAPCKFRGDRCRRNATLQRKRLMPYRPVRQKGSKGAIHLVCKAMFDVDLHLLPLLLKASCPQAAHILHYFPSRCQ